jgi:ribosomal-protein-alanine N-acetyltransferase
MNLNDLYRELPIIRTSRLLLRKLRMDDAEDYFAFASDPRVTRYLRWGPHLSLDDTLAYLTSILDGDQPCTGALWGIEVVQEQKLIGVIHLMDVNPVHLRAEVGVVLNAIFWSAGFGSESLRAVLDFSFTELGLRRVQGSAIAGNISACRMMEKCGMQHEGLLRNYTLQKNEWYDFDLYSILWHEFQSKHPKRSFT